MTGVKNFDDKKLGKRNFVWINNGQSMEMIIATKPIETYCPEIDPEGKLIMTVKPLGEDDFIVLSQYGGNALVGALIDKLGKEVESWHGKTVKVEKITSAEFHVDVLL